MPPFHHLLANNLVANIVNFTVWFALTFWIFLETRSVFATGMIAGIFLVLTASLAIWFGSLVDHHRKRNVMIASSVASLALYGVALGALMLVPEDRRDKANGLVGMVTGVGFLTTSAISGFLVAWAGWSRPWALR